MQTFPWALVASLTTALFLSACSPDQNWRDVGFEGTTLKVQLPCKPDRTTRSVPLGGVPVDMQVVGCESGQAMVAVMSAPLQAGGDANAVLTTSLATAPGPTVSVRARASSAGCAMKVTTSTWGWPLASV